MASTYHTDIQKLYVAYFNRPADYLGLAYWEGVVEAAATAAGSDPAAIAAAVTKSLGAVSVEFSKSAEYTTEYAGLSIEHTVGRVYENLFNRTADLPGLLYWSSEIRAGHVSLAYVVQQIGAGAQGSDLTTLTNKTAASVAFTNELDTGAEVLGYSGPEALAAAKAFLAGITTNASLAAAIVPATLAASVAAVVAAGTPVPPTVITPLTTGLDTILGGAGSDIINGGLIESLSAFDNIDGAAGIDTLNVLTAQTSVAGGVIVKNVEVVNINTSGAGFTVDGSSYTGLTNMNVNLSAQAAGAVVVDAASAVSVATNSTTGAITIGGTTAATGAVMVAQNATLAATAGGAISITGGTTVTVDTSVIESGAGTSTGSAVTVTGTADTTTVTVSQDGLVTAVAAVAAVAAVTESAAIVFNATGLANTESVTIAGLTFTAGAGGATQAQLIAGFASLAAGATAGAAIATGAYSGTLTGFSTGPNVAGTITATSTTAGAPVADIVEVDAAGAINAIVVTQGVAAVTAVDNVTGVATGAVTITDVNAASATAAGKITTVNLDNFGAATVNSGALANVTLAGAGTSFTATAGALTTATATTMNLGLTDATITGAVTLDADYTTVNLVAHGEANTAASLVATGATALNISGDAAVTLSAQSLTATAAITSTSTAAVTLSTALAVGQSYAGGAGVDTITLTASGTKAITTGAGNDTVFYAGPMATGGSVDAGAAGTDTIRMTAAQAATATATTTFAGTISNFEILRLNSTTAAATTINMANADGINHLATNGVANGFALTVTNAAADFTLTQRALMDEASTISLATDVGTADNVNLAFSAADGFANLDALTIANVESIKITTSDTSTTAANAAVITTPIVAAAATTVTVAGSLGVSLIGGMTQTTLTSLDASGLTGTGAFGGLTFTAGALAAAATIKGGAAGLNTIDFSASTKVVTYTGGTGIDTINFATANTKANVVTLGNGANNFNGATNANGNNTITGGTGIDTIAVGVGSNAISAGAGNDIITIGAATGLNTVDVGAGTDTVGFTGIQTAAGYYTSITGMAAGDVINVTGVGSAVSEATLGTKITLGGVSSFANYLDAAVAGNATDAVNWFQFNGNTYITVDNSANATFADGVDTVIELVGLVDLSAAVNAAGVITLA